jgi:Putative prokaryotic signal transducing protein
MSATAEAPDSADPYQTFGYFDPFQAKRILKRFEAAGIRFQLADKSGVEQWDDIFPQYQLRTTVSPRAQRNDRIELFVHEADAEKARQIVNEV